MILLTEETHYITPASRNCLISNNNPLYKMFQRGGGSTLTVRLSRQFLNTNFEANNSQKETMTIIHIQYI